MGNRKHQFSCIKDYYQTIIDLYQSSESDESFIEIFNNKSYDIENIDCEITTKTSINSVEDLLLVLKAKYCLELPLIKTFTPYDNAHYIAGEISRDILLGDFNHKTLSTKQKNMFVKSMYVDFSNLNSFDLTQLCVMNFIKDKHKKFY